MKRIIILADGTWNSPEHGLPTNVLQMARAIAPRAGDVEQVVFYDWGVGTDRLKLGGGLSGAGIDKNIMDGYRFLVHNYDADDELYFFGFSRGAYTVRSLAGFLRNCGLLRREQAWRTPEAYQLYRRRDHASKPDGEMAMAFRAAYAVADITPIEFVGVWDTVGSLGIPVPFWGTVGERNVLFHDTEPSHIVRHARHAMAIDENRSDFAPTCWAPKPGLDLRQVWFAGVHADVGGGYKDAGLSHCAIRWMVDEATACGLRFEPFLLEAIQPNPLDRMHDERTGIYRARPADVRVIQGPLHQSVRTRWEADAYGYRKRSAALKALLASVDGDWHRLDVVG